MDNSVLIDKMWPVAAAIATHVAEWHIHPHGANHQQFGDPANGGWDGSKYVAAAFAEPGVIEYRLRGGAEVRIKDLDVVGVKPEDVDVGPIESVGPQKVVRAQVMSTRNRTWDDVQRELKYRDLQSQSQASTVAKEVGASISAGLRQQVGYGSEAYGIQGETELTLNVEASVKAAWEDMVTTAFEHEMESVRQIVERARHETIVERVETIGPARQVIRAKGALKFGIWIHAPGHFWVEWNSLADFCALLQGIDAKHITNDGSSWRWLYQSYPVPVAKLAAFRDTRYAEIEKVREFEQASNIQIDIKSEPLDEQAALLDAYRLIAEKSDNAELQKLAQAEMMK